MTDQSPIVFEGDMDPVTVANGVAVAPIKPPSVRGGSPPYKWSCENAPAGLLCDPYTGTLTGTPTTQSGQGEATWTVQDQASNENTLSFSWTVE